VIYEFSTSYCYTNQMNLFLNMTSPILFTPPTRHDETVLYCLVSGVNWALVNDNIQTTHACRNTTSRNVWSMTCYKSRRHDHVILSSTQWQIESHIHSANDAQSLAFTQCCHPFIAIINTKFHTNSIEFYASVLNVYFFGRIDLFSIGGVPWRGKELDLRSISRAFNFHRDKAA